MINSRIEQIFNQIADLMEILGQDSFVVNHYRKTARTIHRIDADIEQLAMFGQLKDLNGLGKASIEKIFEFIDTGKIQKHQDLIAEIPFGILDLLKVRGLGPKSIKLIYEKLNVYNLMGLKNAIADGTLMRLPGFGKTKAQNLAKGIKFIVATQGQLVISKAIEMSNYIADHLESQTTIEKIIPAGQIRQGCDSIDTVSIVTLANQQDFPKIIQAFITCPGTREIISQSPADVEITFANENISSKIIKAQLHLATADNLANIELINSSTPEHINQLRQLAKQNNIDLDQNAQTQQQIYQRLNLPYIEPSLRQGGNEIELAQKGKLPKVVQLADIKGDLHIHSPASDGRTPIEQLVETAIERNYQYIAITDHSHSSTIANGLSAERLLGNIEIVRKLNQKYPEIAILAGTEVDIHIDGRLDYPDEILAQLDFVVASVHMTLDCKPSQANKHLLKAMENPYVNCIGHPTTRIIHARPPLPLDIDRIIKQAAETGTALEINSNPFRLDLKASHGRLAVEAGAMLAINTDAHSKANLHLMKFGILTAQRAHATSANIINCQPLETLKKFVQAKRDRMI
ncbi:MAG: DNA polymerase/3'-5' exonuclease PolX [Phycisphaerae bacterium]|nr:DNA polymerase/3'-5' exonuclease PolX [Phycisphaerae bacterium]